MDRASNTPAAVIYFRSSVQRLVLDSSTYAELIAQHDGAHFIQWLLSLRTHERTSIFSLR